MLNHISKRGPRKGDSYCLWQIGCVKYRHNINCQQRLYYQFPVLMVRLSVPAIQYICIVGPLWGESTDDQSQRVNDEEPWRYLCWFSLFNKHSSHRCFQTTWSSCAIIVMSDSEETDKKAGRQTLRRSVFACLCCVCFTWMLKNKAHGLFNSAKQMVQL